MIGIKNSGIHGLGIFALKNIGKGMLIEVCPILILNKKDTKLIEKTKLYNYYFGWKRLGMIALGNGSLYNHSYEPNAKYERDFQNERLKFFAIKPIRKGEEITVNYNGKPEIKKRVWFDKEKK
jgi:SET domain-containing protein